MAGRQVAQPPQKAVGGRHHADVAGDRFDDDGGDGAAMGLTERRD